ncbi:CHAT domain-containing protein [Brevundimonas sp. GN22]
MKISYVLVMPDGDDDGTTPFQGFGRGWTELLPYLQGLVKLPSDIAENSVPIDVLVSQRMGGARMMAWTPLDISALEQITAQQLGFFVVLLSADPAVADRIETWRAAQEMNPLHVNNPGIPGTVAADTFDEARLVEHLRDTLAQHGSRLDTAIRAFIEEKLASWTTRAPEPTGLKLDGHNALSGSQMSLMRAGRDFEEGEPFLGKKESDYDFKILETTRAVFHARKRAGIKNIHRLYLVHPEIWLVEPALYRPVYRRVDARKAPDRISATAIRMLQKQEGFLIPGLDLAAFSQSPSAQGIFQIRIEELHLFMASVGLAASQTTSAVMRLRPGVNRVFPKLSAYARSVRSEKAESKHKARRLFAEIQDQLSVTIGPERMAFLNNEVSGPIKIIAEPPIEWLPIRGLPLMLRHQCSRINPTPGNLMIGQLATSEPITVEPATLQKVLVISSFEDGDPLRNLMRDSIEDMAPMLAGKIKVSFVSVSTVEAFAQALNDFEGAIVIFDGHGTLDGGHGVGALMINGQPLDVWSLRGSVKPPPIVLLSACDTHGVDASSHATVGNGFLALGSLTVLATLLPVGGAAAATFIARLLLRLADFLPAALSAKKTVLNWTEVVTGMLRMTVASEILDELVNKPDGVFTPRGQLQAAANNYINLGLPDWYERLLVDIAGHRDQTVEVVTRLAEQIVARCEAIRYVQLGHPENILIDDGSIRAAVLPATMPDLGKVGVDPVDTAFEPSDEITA